MYIQVRLLKGFPEPLLYAVPKDWDTSNIVGSFVRVPLKQNVFTAFVEKTFERHPDENKFTIRPAISIEVFPQDKNYIKFVSALSRYYLTDKLAFIKRMRQFIQQNKNVETIIKSDSLETKIKATNIKLTDEQEACFDFLKPLIHKPKFTPTLLHGITGSGKTEIYKKLFLECINNNKSCLFLVPEVTLSVQFESLLRETLPQEINIFGFHSATSPKNKKLLWSSLLEQKPSIIIGVHLPTLLPIPNLGLIVIDEEHETGYQEKKHPKINTKECALIRAQINNIPILLGSATPALASLHNIENKGWKFFQLKKRFAGKLPKITTVNLSSKTERRNFWISTKLYKAIADRLIKKEQTIIFINRRGFSFFVQCKECSFVFECPNCSVSLTLHNNKEICCHYCEFKKDLPHQCPKCKAPEKDFIKKGIGTQQTVSIIQKLFPHARVERADMDTTINRKKWKETIEQFQNREIDILVGTQTITKGYHFPHVTLVGVLWADLNLHFPVYNATETTLQQLIQVSGRAGRLSDDSLVIIQTMTEHPIFDYVNELDYINFSQSELETRKMILYPPFTRLVEIEIKNVNEKAIDYESNMLAIELQDNVSENDTDNISILGPAIPPVSKIKNTFSRKIYIKSKNINLISSVFQKINRKKYSSRIFFTPNPIS